MIKTGVCLLWYGFFRTFAISKNENKKKNKIYGST